jgi:RNA polymerase sigma factor (sigma-70 family)
LTEANFINRLKAGDQAAFRDLVSQYSNRVYNTALGLLQHREEAEDITQEVFAEVFQSIGRFRGQSTLSTWIYRITVTKSLELIRHHNRGKRLGVVWSLFGKEDQVRVAANEPFYHPGVTLENKEMAAALFTAVRQLSLNQRTAYTLHKLENLSYAETAEIMKVTISSVESLLFRAKERLQILLKEFYENNLR